ncbi:MAG TPA: hypothetical protein GX517_00080 [Alicyclobacillus sp.]|nr:hypothetical protein [Alicyclobacillus sp.]
MCRNSAHTELRKTWADRVAHFEASGQSAAAWCAAHHVEIDETSTDAEASVVIRVHQIVLEARPGCSPEWLADLVRALMSRC